MTTQLFTTVTIPTEFPSKMAEAIEQALGMAKADWPTIKTVVDEGYGSPYRFADRLREMVNDINAVVMVRRWKGPDGLTQSLYFAISGETMAIYNPSFRPGPQALPIDWFAAIDELGAK